MITLLFIAYFLDITVLDLGLFLCFKTRSETFAIVIAPSLSFRFFRLMKVLLSFLVLLVACLCLYSFPSEVRESVLASWIGLEFLLVDIGSSLATCGGCIGISLDRRHEYDHVSAALMVVLVHKRRHPFALSRPASVDRS